MTTEEYFADSDRLRSFVETVKATANEHEQVEPLLAELEGPFEALLTDDWLPEMYRWLPPDDYENMGEMGDDIAQWLLYRDGHELALFTLVLPPGASTPVHDHLAWGLVGIYGGEQRETFYRRVDDDHYHPDDDHAELEKIRTDRMTRGDFYELVPPNNDIHSVTTTSDEPSVSVHLLGADVGCIERHAFNPENKGIERFQSGYMNVECDVTIDPPAGD
jgi:predicted metal-dependent enzyme (double-stranded beta helix superfamily)